MFNYTKEEILILPLMFLGVMFLSVLIGFLLRKQSDKIKNIPFMAIAIILLAMEVVKQILSISSGNWSWWAFPLHFCSMFMVWFSLASFAKGKVKQAGLALSFVSCLFFLMLFYFNPSSIIGESTANVFGSFASFHTFAYHHFILLFLGLMITLKTYKVKYIFDVKSLLILYGSYFVLAVTLANITQTNYCNLLHSNIPFMQNILDKAGYIVYLITMLLVGLGIPIVFITITRLIQRRYSK